MDINGNLDQGFIWAIGTGGVPAESTPYYFGVKTRGAPVRILASDFSTDAANLLITLYENTTFTGGTNLTPVNRNREIAPKVSAPFEILTNVTPSTVLPQNIIARDGIKTTNRTTANVTSPGTSDLLLASNKEYVLELKNLSGLDGEVDVSIFILCKQFEPK